MYIQSRNLNLPHYLNFLVLAGSDYLYHTETVNKIRDAGLKVTPQRKSVYEVMMRLRHATMDEIITGVQKKDSDMRLSTIYRILDSFCKAGMLSLVCHPGTGKCYYDISVTEHHHVFDGMKIMDYMDPELTGMIREYLLRRNFDPGEIEKIQVQITLNKNNV